MSFRSRARELAMQSLYQSAVQKDWKIEEDFSWLDKVPHSTIVNFAMELISGTVAHLDEINQYIEKNLKRWKMDRVGEVEKAILRISVYSLLYQKDIDVSVTVNEAIELARKFCEDESFSFINGVLDAIAAQIRQA